MPRTKKAETFGKALRNVFLSPGMISVLAAPAVTYGVGRLARERQMKERAAQKIEGFREMVELHPHFKKRDPNEVARVYNSLHNISPHVARDPLYAGAWVDSVLEQKLHGMTSHQALLAATKDLGQLQKNVSEVGRWEKQDAGEMAQIIGNTLINMGQTAEKNIANGINVQMDRMTDKQKEVEGKLKEYKGYYNVVKQEADTNPRARARLNRYLSEKRSSAQQAYSELDRLFDALQV